MYWDTTPPRTRLPALLTGETSPTTSALLYKNRAVHDIYDVFYRRERKASVLVTRVDTGGRLLSSAPASPYCQPPPYRIHTFVFSTKTP